MQETDLPFNSPQFKEIWEEWLQYRRERKLPVYKPTGLKRTFSMLVTDSENNEDIAIEMIIKSISQNWQGIFKISNNGNNTTKLGTSAARIIVARNW